MASSPWGLARVTVCFRSSNLAVGALVRRLILIRQVPLAVGATAGRWVFHGATWRRDRAGTDPTVCSPRHWVACPHRGRLTLAVTRLSSRAL